MIDKQTTGNYIIELIRCAVTGESPDPAVFATFKSWESLYEMANFHSVANLVAYAVDSLPDEVKPPKEIMDKLDKVKKLTQARESMQHFAFQACFHDFEENGIRYLPLKGWVLKHLYPRPDMRSMCDVDVLIDERNKKKAEAILKKHGLRLSTRGQNHDIYMKLPYLTLELHWNLFQQESSYHTYFLSALDHAEQRSVKEDRNLSPPLNLEMTKEDFYIFFLAHLAKHYNGGGTGIRSILDIWVYHNHYKDTLDHDYLERELDKIGLLTLFNRLTTLSNVWFSGAKPDEVTEEMGRYILSSGTYGLMYQGILSRLSEEEGGNKYKYLIKRVFPSAVFLRRQFPKLGKSPILLPVCWFARFVRILIKNDNLRYELSHIKSCHSEDVERLREIKKKSGL